MRNRFGQLLAESIAKDERIWVLTGDLGFGVLNKTREAAPDRAYNVGAAEQLMVGAAVGLAHNNKIPICYSPPIPAHSICFLSFYTAPLSSLSLFSTCC